MALYSHAKDFRKKEEGRDHPPSGFLLTATFFSQIGV
jgi:hypothetical protein